MTTFICFNRSVKYSTSFIGIFFLMFVDVIGCTTCNVPFSNMDILEIRLLNVALNDPDMQALHNQMSVAYGLPVM
jgi:hypothetical protein